MPFGRRLPVLCVASLLVMTCGRTELDQPGKEDSGSTTGVAGTGGTEGPGTGGDGVAGGGAGGGAGAPVGGAGGRGGTTGAAGRGGTTGAAGVSGRGGTTGAAGRGGTTGSAGAGAAGARRAGRGGRGQRGRAAGRRGGHGRTRRRHRRAGAAVAGVPATAEPRARAARRPLPIPCGQTELHPGRAVLLRHAAGAMCISAGATCTGGANIGCLEGSACGRQRLLPEPARRRHQLRHHRHLQLRRRRRPLQRVLPVPEHGSATAAGSVRWASAAPSPVM